MAKTRKNSAKMNMIHFKTLVARYCKQITGSVPSFLMLILQVPILLIVVALIYVRECFNYSAHPEHWFIANTMLFILVFIGALMGLLNSYREITKEREILAREISGGLDPVSYVASKLFVQALIAAAQAIMITCGSLIFMDFYFKAPVIDGLRYLAVMFLVILSSSSIGLLISALVKKSETAVLPVLIIIICQVVFSGVFFDLSEVLNLFSYILPARWGCGIMGRLLNINLAPPYSKPIYNINLFMAFSALVIIIASCYAITVAIIKKRYGTKKK